MRFIAPTPVLLQIYYYRLDFPSILQDFTWGYEDIVPELVKTHKFLNHWHKNIKVPVAEVLLSIDEGYRRKWRSVDEYLNLN